MLKLVYKSIVIVGENVDSWITPGNLILGFEYPNREIGMVESNFYMWSLINLFIDNSTYCEIFKSTYRIDC